MAEYMQLIGAEDVSRAARTMQGAADEITQAMRNFDASCDRLVRALETHAEVMIRIMEPK